MFSQTLMSGPEYMAFVGMNVLKILQRLAATTKRFFWKTKLPKISRNFDR